MSRTTATQTATAMTDADNMARIAALGARRGQPSLDLSSKAMWGPPHPSGRLADPRVESIGAAATRGASPPAWKRRRKHVAGGARIVAGGMAVSGMFGLTAVLAAANRPPSPSAAAALPTAPPPSTVLLSTPCR